MTNAFITGIAGQDGSYLAEFLLAKGYTIFGLDHPQSTPSYEYIQPFRDRLHLIEGDLCDDESLTRALGECKPDEIYNLAAMSFPPASWQQPTFASEITGLGVTRLLEAARKIVPQTHIYQASSSEMFGGTQVSPQNEETPFAPRNPYGTSKVYGHWMTGNYRQQYGMFAVSGILFNHESPRRGLEYVTRKITRGAASIKRGLTHSLSLGNLDARRDWGYAGDYVCAMWMMLQHSTPTDFVVGTGQTHSVRELCDCAFGYLGLDYHDYVIQDPALYRPTEAVQLVADPRKANQELGWGPEVDFNSLIRMMVDADIKA